MTYDCYGSTPDIRGYINVLRETNCPFSKDSHNGFHTTKLRYLIPYSLIYLCPHFCHPPILHRLVLGVAPPRRYLTFYLIIGFNLTNACTASIRGSEYYQCVQTHLLICLAFADVASLSILAWCISEQMPFRIPIIAIDICLVPYVCGCVLLHHFSFIAFPRIYCWPHYLSPRVVLDELSYSRRQREIDRAEWASQDTTLYCDDWDDERIDHRGDTEPLLLEWLIEQQRLNQMDADDADDDTESTFSTYSPVNIEWDLRFDNGDSGYGSDNFPPADAFLLPAAISD